MPTITDLIAAVEGHLARTGTSASAFGRKAVGDPCFVRDLRAGREPRSRVVSRVVEYMKANPEPAARDETHSDPPPVDLDKN